MDTLIYKCPVTGHHFDPLSVQRKLLTLSKGQFNSWLADQRGDDELKAMEAEEKILPVVRSAFGFREIDKLTGAGEGTEVCLEVLSQYLQWVEVKKVRGQTLQTSSPCVDCPQ